MILMSAALYKQKLQNCGDAKWYRHVGKQFGNLI